MSSQCLPSAGVSWKEFSSFALGPDLELWLLGFSKWPFLSFYYKPRILQILVFQFSLVLLLDR